MPIFTNRIEAAYFSFGERSTGVADCQVERKIYIHNELTTTPTPPTIKFHYGAGCSIFLAMERYSTGGMASSGRFRSQIRVLIEQGSRLARPLQWSLTDQPPFHFAISGRSVSSACAPSFWLGSMYEFSRNSFQLTIRIVFAPLEIAPFQLRVRNSPAARN